MLRVAYRIGKCFPGSALTNVESRPMQASPPTAGGFWSVAVSTLPLLGQWGRSASISVSSIRLGRDRGRRRETVGASVSCLSHHNFLPLRFARCFVAQLVFVVVVVAVGPECGLPHCRMREIYLTRTWVALQSAAEAESLTVLTVS